jgi:hypothetical protein
LSQQPQQPANIKTSAGTATIPMPATNDDFSNYFLHAIIIASKEFLRKTEHNVFSNKDQSLIRPNGNSATWLVPILILQFDSR